MPLNKVKQMQQQAWQNPQAFWRHAATQIEWMQPVDQVLDDRDAPFYRWFPGASLNTCYNAVDRHVEAGHGQQVAIQYVSPVTGTEEAISYQQLQQRVATLAGAMANLGVGKGDRVVIYMPMIPETAYAMLACARLGAVHSVVFGGFAPPELASRIDDAKPKLVLSASCGIEPSGVIPYKPLLDKALDLCEHRVEYAVVFQRPQCPADLERQGDRDWQQLVAQAQPVPCVEVAASDPLYILYTSGTTGRPKGVVRDNGGHAVALAWSMKQIYNIDAGDVFWAASDVGWVVGHSYIVYGPLLARATTLLYEGKPVGTPDAGAFWRIIEQYRVKTFFTAPTAIRAIKRVDATASLLQGVDISSLQALFLAGERCDPDTLTWAADMLQVPVVDHWWQTETGWPICANPLGMAPLPIKPGSPALAVPGYQVEVLDELGQPVAAGQSGAVTIKLPLPPGTLMTLWNNDDRYRDGYLSRYPGYYLTGDAGYMDEDGYLYVMGRVDDIINVAGHRLSTGRFEEVLAQHGAVAEAAVIGVKDTLKGQLPLGLVVLKQGMDTDLERIKTELVALVRAEVGAVAAFKLVAVVEKLPKTRSGKILRGTMRKLANGETVVPPATIEDPDSLNVIGQALAQMGLTTAHQPVLDLS
ncbi:propionyl-CoA synthetase [Ferrimonas sp. SCSIO 43195]|uniref:propionyl-CoA synthetase n=1 Tax=Ferrimonas sp. SCSIO 43195 TaxID=2822844 RepID=UPI002074B8C3|nr:propionyl-CoA synthetase [Ferrimonas sp. SCSIO 43195]USD36737.1 propionyl-CoA synthetase [Ferrimonas sp. SCSIO 43195]